VFHAEFAGMFMIHLYKNLLSPNDSLFTAIELRAKKHFAGMPCCLTLYKKLL